MRQITKGATDQSVVIRIVDASDGTPETGVTSATSGIDLEYRRDGAASVDITESDLSALTDAHSDGGLLHIGNGYYRLDVPDAAFATGVDGVLIHGTVTDMVVIGTYVELVNAKITGDPYARLGAPAGASVSADIAAVKAETASILTDTGTTLDGKIDAIDTVVDAIKAKTDSLTFTQAGAVDSNITHINETAVQGDGAATPWGPA